MCIYAKRRRKAFRMRIYEKSGVCTPHLAKSYAADFFKGRAKLTNYADFSRTAVTFEERTALRFASVGKRGSARLLSRCCSRLLLHGLVGSDFAVADMDDAVRMLRNVVLVRNQNDRVSLPIQILE
jgi:hypothetical protein